MGSVLWWTGPPFVNRACVLPSGKHAWIDHYEQASSQQSASHPGWRCTVSSRGPARWVWVKALATVTDAAIHPKRSYLWFPLVTFSR